jgi:hypothetical protein
MTTLKTHPGRGARTATRFNPEFPPFWDTSLPLTPITIPGNFPGTILPKRFKSLRNIHPTPLPAKCPGPLFFGSNPALSQQNKELPPHEKFRTEVDDAASVLHWNYREPRRVTDEATLDSSFHRETKAFRRTATSHF